MKKNINLVLGGGGANGIASIGVLLELVNKNYNIKTITGTSAGAIVAGIYSTFVESFPSTIDIIKYLNKLVAVDFEYFKDKDYFNFISFYGKKLFFQDTNFTNFGLYKGKNLHN
jgi:predicted acylesterase/phospholipase RssA